MRLRLTASAPHVDLQRRTITGTVVRYNGEIGMTSAGPLSVRAGALRFPAALDAVAFTLEHDRTIVRGSLALVDDTTERLYVAVRVVDGALGDAALAEALDRGPDGRGGLSFDLENVDIDNGEIVAADVAAIGQVRAPAYNSARIDRVAAAQNPQQGNPTPGVVMTPEQIARLAALRDQQNLTAEERAELTELTDLAAQATVDNAAGDPDAPAEAEPTAPATAVAASMPAVPGGVPAPAAPARTSSRRGAYTSYLDRLVTAAHQGGRASVTAALSDVISTGISEIVEPPAWSGELWSGLQYQPKWTPLFGSDSLTALKGSGWRWVTKPEVDDYAGDKTEIPSNEVEVEPSEWEAARMAGGWDLDRKFFDFPDRGFLDSFFKAGREDWARKLDAKVRAYALAAAVTYGTAQTTFLDAITLAFDGVDENTEGASATFVAVNKTDFRELMGVTTMDAPAFLDLYNIDLKNLVRDSAVPAGTVVAGVRQAATVRTLPGSPIRVDAQNIANGGVDSGLFGYWAIEEHHPTAIVKTTFA